MAERVNYIFALKKQIDDLICEEINEASLDNEDNINFRLGNIQGLHVISRILDSDVKHYTPKTIPHKYSTNNVPIPKHQLNVPDNES